MDYGLIGKRDKARRYAEEERERFTFHKLEVEIVGSNNNHVVKYDKGEWDCDCDYFASHGYCSHTMALEIILENMLEDDK